MVLLSPIDVALVSQLEDKGVVCEVAHKYECPCVFQNRGRGIKRVRWLHKQYKWADSWELAAVCFTMILVRKILRRLSYEAKYNRDDFIVENLTTFTDDIPRTRTKVSCDWRTGGHEITRPQSSPLIGRTAAWCPTSPSSLPTASTS